jgi:hypothetical protein
MFRIGTVLEQDRFDPGMLFQEPDQFRATITTEAYDTDTSPHE